MIVSFFGHSDFIPNESIKSRLMEILNDTVGGASVEFYLGGYGGFDYFALGCSLFFKQGHKNSRIVLVTPYVNLSRRLSSIAEKCNDVIYPALESVPPKFAISARNVWMADKADIVICYVNHAWGGAYAACKYCVTKGTKLINLGNLDFLK